jgi:hypothetical protein
MLCLCDVHTVAATSVNPKATVGEGIRQLRRPSLSGVALDLDAVRADPRGKGSVVLVATEFGRRVWSNASWGVTQARLVEKDCHRPTRARRFLRGHPRHLQAVRGNQIYTTHFRSVYSTAFERVLGVGSEMVPGRQVPGAAVRTDLTAGFVGAASRTRRVGANLPTEGARGPVVWCGA